MDENNPISAAVAWQGKGSSEKKSFGPLLGFFLFIHLSLSFLSCCYNLTSLKGEGLL